MSTAALLPSLRAGFRRARRSSAHLLFGALTSLLALLGLLGLATSLVGVGLPAAPWLLDRLRRLAAWERERAGRWLGVWIVQAYRPLPELGWWSRGVARARDPQTWRDIGWLAVHGLLGYPIAALVCVLWLLLAASWLSIPGYVVVQRWFPAEEFAYQGVPVTGPVSAVVLPLAGTAIAAVLVVVLTPRVADGLARLAARLLGPTRGARLRDRIDHLSRTRTDTVEAQATELRRIERDLHDGVQARLTSVALRLGMLEHQLAHQLDPEDPARTLATDARLATEDALTELRHLVRTMYPPILADRGLPGALAALAAQSPLHVAVDDADLPALPPSIAAAAYHVVAEALSNAARHSGADAATVRATFEGAQLEVTVTDAGDGGADPAAGTGLTGLRRRLAALDGQLHVESPPGGPTTVRASLPVVFDDDADAAEVAHADT